MVCQIPKSLNFCLSIPLRRPKRRTEGRNAAEPGLLPKSAIQQHAQIRLPFDGRILQTDLVAKSF